jgi:hypothetical protein
MLGLFCGSTYKELKTAVLAVLEHHFDNHQYCCGGWCKANIGTAKEIQERGSRFQCKTRYKQVYLFMKKHHEEFMVDAKLSTRTTSTASKASTSS